MNRSPTPQPPRWMKRFFRWYCKPEYQEDIEGDLQERFHRNVDTSGNRAANWRFFWDVLLLFRPGIIRTPSVFHPFIPYTMLRFNLILAFRNAMRHKGTFLINLMGLSIGLACVLLIYLWVEDERKVDHFHIKEGRSFSMDFATDSSAIIFNEAAIKAMGLDDPIGKTIQLWRQDYHIIGISENFHFTSLHEEITPCFMRAVPEQYLENVLVKIDGNRIQESLALLGEKHAEYNQGLPFEYSFLEEDYQQLYASEQRVSLLSRYFAGIAILISCLGLLGLATYSAERRIKEMGIRKILGATEWQLVRLLSRDFTRLVLIALVLSLPLSYLLAQNWLQEFAYRAPLNSWIFVGTGIIALFLAWSTVGLQTLKVARMNPVECLRDE